MKGKRDRKFTSVVKNDRIQSVLGGEAVGKKNSEKGCQVGFRTDQGEYRQLGPPSNREGPDAQVKQKMMH